MSRAYQLGRLTAIVLIGILYLKRKQIFTFFRNLYKKLGLGKKHRIKKLIDEKEEVTKKGVFKLKYYNDGTMDGEFKPNPK